MAPIPIPSAAQLAYERLLGPEALSDAQGLADALSNAQPHTLAALDAELQRAGVAEWLAGQPARESSHALLDDEPMNLSADEIARGEAVLASMLSSAGMPPSRWREAANDVAAVTEVEVHPSASGDHATVTLTLDVPRESIDAWRAVQRVQRVAVGE